MSKDMDKLAAEMKNIKPSKSSRKSGMDAALAAFDKEFAEGVEKEGVAEINSQPSQGSADAPRLTGQNTRAGRVQAFGSTTMRKINTIFSFTPKTKMMMGSCAAALMATVFILPLATDSIYAPELEEKFDNISSAMEPADEIVTTGSRRSSDVATTIPSTTAEPKIDAGKSAPQSSGGIASVNELLMKVRKDADKKASENARREAEFDDRRGQRGGILPSLNGAPVESQQVEKTPNTTSTNSDKGEYVPGSVGYGASQDIDFSGDLIGTLTDIPSTAPSATSPRTEIVERGKIKTPARTVERIVPPITKMETRRIKKADGSYETVMKPVVVQEAIIERVEIPATYETQTRTVVVQSNSRDQFENYESNPVTSVDEKPVSTFSIDVDTASYSFLRSSINRGQLPSPGAIRLEEMINYFPYDYEAPRSADEPFKANVTVTPTPWNADTKLMHVGIKGYVPPATERPDSNIVLLIDTSGSMNQPNKLPLLINSFKLLLNTLDEDDTVSIVTYAGSAGTVLEPTPASEKGEINAALNRLRAGGSTAGAAGLELAYMKAAESFDEDGVNRVILATDGDFNVGFSSPDEMKTFIEKKRKTGVFLSVLGFGNGNYNDHLMQSLAQNGNGVAAYIDSLAEANKVLADEAGSALITIAKDVKIQVEFNPDTISEYRLIGYETRALKREDFNNDKVDAGEIGAGHSVTAIYELTPVGSPARTVDDLRYVSADADDNTTGSDEFAFVKIRHKLPNADKSTLQTFPIGPGKERSLKRASDDMRFATAVAAVGQKLRGDTQLDSFSYDDAIKLATDAKGDDENGYRAEFIQLVRLMDVLQ